VGAPAPQHQAGKVGSASNAAAPEDEEQSSQPCSAMIGAKNGCSTQSPVVQPTRNEGVLQGMQV